MSQPIACPHCKQPLILPAGLSAAQIRCPRCKKPFALPAAPAVVLAAPPPSPPAPTRPAPPPASKSAGADAPPGFDMRRLAPALRLLPAALLAWILLLFMVRDRFVGGETDS